MVTTENLHFYVQDAAKHDIAALNAFMERAQKMYDDNMTSYIRAVLRRSFGKPRVSVLLFFFIVERSWPDGD